MNILKNKTLLFIGKGSLLQQSDIKQLEEAGSVALFCSGEHESINAIFHKHNAIDLALIDIDSATGFDVTEIAEVIHKNHDIPILFLYSAPGKSIVAKTRIIPSFGYVSKSAGIPILLASIDTAFQLSAKQFTHKKMETAVKESEQKFRDLFENAPIGIFHTSLKGQFLTANPALARMLGYDSPGELIRGTTDLTTQIYTDPLARPKVIKELLKSDGWIHREEILWRKDGSHLTVDLIARKVLTTRGEISYFEGYAEDITERTLAESALRESEQKLQAIFNIANIGISITNAEGKYVLFNPWWVNFLGYDSDEIKARTNLEITHPEDREKSRTYFLKVVNGEIEKYRFEKRFIRKDNAVVWGDLSVSPVKDQTGKVIFMAGMVNDITEKKKTEEALRQSEEKILLLLNSAAEAIYGIDTNGRCTFCNKAAFQILGYSAEQELIGKNMHDAIHHSHNDGSLYPVQECSIFKAFLLKEGTHVDSEVLWRKDGSSFPAEYWSYPMFREEKLIGAVVTFFDITERKHAELQLRKYAEELQAANETKDKFFSIIAHDLRSPFNHFLGLSSILAEGSDSLSKSKIYELSMMLHSSLTKQFNLLTDLLNWAKLQSKNFALQPEPVVLREQADSVFDELSLTAKQKEIELHNLAADNLTAMADVNMLKLVLRNLISNALKFTYAHGFVSVSAVEKNNFVEVRVSDNGMGISAEDQLLLFAPAFHHTTDGTNKEKGTGLGLMLCKEIIEKHGGSLWVESELGKGATFIFTLLPA